MLQLALMAFLAAFICYFVQWTFGQPMIDQPICVGLIAGLIFGDITTGIVIGAAMEVIFIGNVNVGGATSAEPVTGTVMAVCFVTHMGMDQGAAITLATAVAIFANIIYSLIFNVLMSFWSPLIDWAASTGETKSVALVHFGGALVMNGAMAIPTFLGVYFGAEPVANLVNVIPAAVTNGFNTAAGLLPAVGMALLIRMLWNSRISVYFLLGFVCVSYLGMPMVGVAALGAVLIMVEAYRQLDLLDVKKKLQALRTGGGAVQAETQDKIEEENFFA